MKKATKIALIVAAALIMVGAVLFAGVMLALGFDFSRLSTQHLALQTFEIREDFNRIAIDTETADITLAPSGDGTTRVEFRKEEKINCSVAVEADTLTIVTTDDRTWLDQIGIYSKGPSMILYLPKEAYTALSIQVTTGNVTLPEQYQLETLSIAGTTANIDCRATVASGDVRVTTGHIQWDAASAGDLRLITTTGSIALKVSTAGDVQCTAQTGNMELTDIACQSINALNNTGNVELTNVTAESYIFAECSTGNIRLEACDAGELYLRTTTGHVAGTVLTEKIFITDTSTGIIGVPKTATGGKCEIITTTGNIQMEIEE